jgi:hypothetical protein
MKLKTLAQLLVFSGTAVCFGAMLAFGDANCRQVGGSVLTISPGRRLCGVTPAPPIQN